MKKSPPNPLPRPDLTECKYRLKVEMQRHRLWKITGTDITCRKISLNNQTVMLGLSFKVSEPLGFSSSSVGLQNTGTGKSQVYLRGPGWIRVRL